MPEKRDLVPAFEPDDENQDATRQPGERFALIIGIDRYADPQIRDLNFAAADAQAIHDILMDPQLGRFDPANVTLLLDEEATERRIREVMAHELPDRAGSDDTVVVYFAGHGSPVVARGGNSSDGMEKYLVPSDASLSRLRASAIPMEEVQKWFGWMSARQVLFFLDCCYSGAAEGRTVSDARITSRAALTDDFLDRLGGNGRLVVTACDVNEVSLESPELKHGIFTHYLAEGLKGAADRDQDGLVTIDELYDYLFENVQRRARELSGQMTPVKKGSVRGRIYLTRYETEAQQEAAALAEQARSIAPGDGDASEFLWRRVLELLPGNPEATERLAAIESDRRERHARRHHIREALIACSTTGQISLDVFSYAMTLLERPAEAMDEQDRHLVVLLGAFAQGSVPAAVVGHTVQAVLKAKAEPKDGGASGTTRGQETGSSAPSNPTQQPAAGGESSFTQEAAAAATSGLTPEPAAAEPSPSQESPAAARAKRSGGHTMGADPARERIGPIRSAPERPRRWGVRTSVGASLLALGAVVWVALSTPNASPEPGTEVGDAALAVEAPGASGPTIVEFSASPSSVALGDKVTLTWRTVGLDSVALASDYGPPGAKGYGTISLTNLEDTGVEPDFSQWLPPNGSAVHQPSSATTAYRLTAYTDDGSLTREASIAVHSVPRVELFELDRTSIREGENVTLRWRVANAGNATIRLTEDNPFPYGGKSNSRYVESSGSLVFTPAPTFRRGPSTSGADLIDNTIEYFIRVEVPRVAHRGQEMTVFGTTSERLTVTVSRQ